MNAEQLPDKVRQAPGPTGAPLFVVILAVPVLIEIGYLVQKLLP